MLGHNHPETLRSISNLGITLWSQGKYAKTEAVHRQVLETRNTVLSRNHPEILANMSGIGNALE